MDARTPHYLRFVRTLALATTLALPACADPDGAAADDEGSPAGAITESPGTAPDTSPTAAAMPRPTTRATLFATATPAPAPAPSDEMDGGAGGQSHGPKSSGPLPPPEMPASLA